MRILHVLNTNKFSGAENVAITIINKMNKNNEIVYVSPNGKIKEKLKENKIQYEPIKKMSISEIRRIYKKYKPDIIHAHDFRASIIVAFSGLHVKIISHIHKNDPKMKNVNIYSILYALSCLKYSKILMVSPEIGKEFVFNKLIQDKEEIIGNPVDTEKIIKLSGNNKEKRFDIVYLGRLSAEKNPKEFIEIVKEIVKKKPYLKCVMIGDGLEKEDCIKLISKYNLEDNIEMVGFLDNPYKLLKMSKIMCITSNWEGFGLVAAEALTLGVPVIAKNIGGLKDIVDSNCGDLVITREEFINKILNLLNDEMLLKEKSKNAINKAKMIFDIKSYIENLERIYNQNG